MNRLYEAVTDRNPLTREWEGRLAERWVIGADNLSAVFTIRKGVTWSDGTPLTAKDVVYSAND